MQNRIIPELDAVLGKTFKYKGKVITLKSYKDINGTVAVLTDKQTITKYAYEINNFVQQLEPTDMLPSAPDDKGSSPAETPQSFSYQKSPIHIKLENALSKMIDQVEASEKAIPQAKALCDITNSMVNLEKQQILMLKATGQI